MSTSNTHIPNIVPQNPDTNWVALDLDNKIISEGITQEEAIKKAEIITKDYALMFVFKEGVSYIF